ncbi:MAG TPA: threonylcarbamoyl-AMP synthase [Clostridia bacterium]|nr:threonylcarbamoyl-AMP synthase [Clostridia bacterium]
METKIWSVSASQPEPEIIKQAATLIRQGGLVAFPTETVYGLGADGLNPQAVEKIFKAKERPTDNPLILHVADFATVGRLARQVDERATKLISAFWPGPLTLVLPKQKSIPNEVTAGLDTVAIRMPRHPVALALIKASGTPLAAPSANRSGYPSPTTGQHVYTDLAGRIEAILESGPTGVGLESTVLDLSGTVPVVWRPGGVSLEELTAILGTVEMKTDLKYTHYAPRAEVVLLQGSTVKVAAKIKALVDDYSGQGKKIGLLLTAETWIELGEMVEKSAVLYQQNLGSSSHLENIARIIYRELRNCDLAGVEIILTETYQRKGLGVALMNRLLKSANGQVINV